MKDNEQMQVDEEGTNLSKVEHFLGSPNKKRKTDEEYRHAEIINHLQEIIRNQRELLDFVRQDSVYLHKNTITHQLASHSPQPLTTPSGFLAASAPQAHGSATVPTPFVSTLSRGVQGCSVSGRQIGGDDDV